MSSKNLIVKCSHCKRFFSAKEFDSHECELPINGAKEIPVVYFREDFRGKKKTIVGRGTDGVLYAFVVESRKPIPLILPSRRIFTDNRSDDNLTEPPKAKFINVQ